MRAALVLVALLAACAAASAHPAKGAAKLSAVPEHRLFEAHGLEMPTLKDTEYCNGIKTTVTTTLTQCLALQSVISSLGSLQTVEAATTAYTQLCPSDCFKGIQELTSSAETLDCFETKMQETFKLFAAQCTQESGEYCGVTLVRTSIATACGSQTTQTACEAKPACMWELKNSKCEVNMETVFEAACTPCTELAVAAAPTQMKDMAMACHQENGKYCGRYVADFVESIEKILMNGDDDSSSSSGSESSSSNHGSSKSSGSWSSWSSWSGSSSSGSSGSSSMVGPSQESSSSGEASSSNWGPSSSEASGSSGSSASVASSSGSSRSGSSGSSGASGSSSSSGALSSSSFGSSGSSGGSSASGSGSSATSSGSSGSLSGSSASGSSTSSGSSGHGSSSGDSWSSASSSHGGWSGSSESSSASSSSFHWGSSSSSSFSSHSAFSSSSGSSWSWSHSSVASESSSGSSSGPVAVVNSLVEALGVVCNLPTAFKCMKYSVALLAEALTENVQSTFVSCVSSVNNQTQAVVQYCLPALAQAYMVADLFNLVVEHGCSRNTDGEWCLEQLQLLLIDPCVDDVLTTATCTTACGASIKESLTSFGCCSGTIEDLLFSKWTLDPSVVPPFNGRDKVLSSSSSGQSSGSGFNSMSYFGTKCSNVGTTDLTPCVTPTDVSSKDACFQEEFIDKLTAAQVKCSSAVNPLDDIESFNTLAAANAAFKTFCTTDCYAALSDLKSYPGCLDTSMLQAVQLVGAACTPQEGNTDVYCGAVFTQVGALSCAHTSKATCEADDNCAWVTQDGETSCEGKPTDTLLGQVCSPCLGLFANALGAGTAATLALTSVNLLMCQMEGTTYCYNTAIEAFRKMDLTSGFDTTTLEPICATDLAKKCMRRVMNGVSTIATTSAMIDYGTCYGKASANSEIRTCALSYLSEVNNAHMLQKIVGSLCKKSQGGSYCMSVMKTYESSACLDKLLSAGTCSAACDTELAKMVTDIGCCVGTLQDIFKTPIITVDDVPVGAEGIVPTESPNVPTAEAGSGESLVGEDAGSGFLMKLSACTSFKSNIRAKLAVGCPFLRAEQVEKKGLALPLVWSKLSADTKLLGQMTSALGSDVATALGSPKDAYTNPTLVENTAAQVPLARDRRMHTHATATGAAYKFNIQSESNADTAAQSAQLDKQVGSGNLQLSSAASTAANGCKGCIGAGGLKPTTAGTSDGSSASALSAALAALVALAMILAL